MGLGSSQEPPIQVVIDGFRPGVTHLSTPPRGAVLQWEACEDAGCIWIVVVIVVPVVTAIADSSNIEKTMIFSSFQL
jgi:hypothetical protein